MCAKPCIGFHLLHERATSGFVNNKCAHCTHHKKMCPYADIFASFIGKSLEASHTHDYATVYRYQDPSTRGIENFSDADAQIIAAWYVTAFKT